MHELGITITRVSQNVRHSLSRRSLILLPKTAPLGQFATPHLETGVLAISPHEWHTPAFVQTSTLMCSRRWAKKNW